jgi:magnesium transporter
VSPFKSRLSGKAGLPPGSLVHVGEKKMDRVRIHVIDYDRDHLAEKDVEGPSDCAEYRESPTRTWIDVKGLHNVEIIEGFGELFSIHPLVLEDILNTGQRPKTEEHEGYLLVICKMLSYDEDPGEVRVEQVSIIVAPSLVITFQEKEGDVFEPVRERIRRGRGRIRKMDEGYLVYALLDAVVDNYFVMLDKIGTDLEDLEEEIMGDPGPHILDKVHVLKRELILMRRSIWPMREVLGGLQREESPLMSEHTGIFLRDAYEHTIQVIETVETYNEMASSLMDYYMSSLNNRMSEVMKVLTVVATIFIPLTFIAGVYGMNFEHMPELAWTWGYPVALGVMLGIAGGMIYWFKRNRFF